MSSRRLTALFAGALATLAFAVHADAPRAELRADDPLSELGVARIADENGDALLVRASAGELGRAAALIAIRAAPYAAAPEALWAGLFAHACGRDPALAPEAAAALTRLEVRLDGAELGQREVLIADLQKARAALGCPADAAPPRADLAAALGRFRARLDALLAALNPG
jgi:hypothetical protein